MSTRNQVSAFLDSLSILLNAGMSIGPALRVLEEEAGPGKWRNILTKIRVEVESGHRLSQVLEGYSFFPRYVVLLVKVGEQAGQLDQNLKVIVDIEYKARSLRSKLKAATVYPSLVLLITVIVGVVVAWFILPRLATVFESLHIQLPLISVILFVLGRWFSQYGILTVMLVTGLLFVLWYLTFIFSKTSILVRSFLFHIPGIRKLIQQSELSRSLFILGTLLQVGLSIPECFASLKDSTQNVPYRRLFNFLENHLNDGDSFKKSFSLYVGIDQLIPRTTQSLLITGEESGTLPDICLKLAHLFDEKTDLTSRALPTILEPVLLVLVWLGVVAVALAVILPIYSLVGQIQP